jgi:hypothetical protein
MSSSSRAHSILCALIEVNPDRPHPEWAELYPNLHPRIMHKKSDRHDFFSYDESAHNKTTDAPQGASAVSDLSVEEIT